MLPSKNKQPKVILTPNSKPNLLRNNEWQALLRKQFAQIQKLKVRNTGTEIFYSNFEVFNPQTKNKYNVAIRSVTEPTNYCDCLDFKTNKLGTCKHIEAVFLSLENLTNVVQESKKIVEKKYTSIYVNYLQQPKIKIRIGTLNFDDIRRLTKGIFDADNYFDETQIENLNKFIETYFNKYQLKIYDDAKLFLENIEQKHKRIQTIQSIENNQAIWDDLLKIKLRKNQVDAIKFFYKNGKAIIANTYGLGLGVTALGAICFVKKINPLSKILIVTNNAKYWQQKAMDISAINTMLIDGSKLAISKLLSVLSNDVKLINASNAAASASIINTENFDFILYDDTDFFASLNDVVSKQLKTIGSKFMLLLATYDISKNIESFYSQIQAVNIFAPGTIFNFLNRFSIKNAQGKIVAPKNEEELKTVLKNIYLFRDTLENEGSKNNIFTKTCRVNLSVSHAEFYYEMRSELTSEFLDKSINDIEFIEQIIEASTFDSTSNNNGFYSKLYFLKSVIETLNAEGKQIVIVTQFEKLVNFITTFFIQNNIENTAISIYHVSDVNSNLIETASYVICTDAQCFVNINSENLLPKNVGCYTIIASNTFEELYLENYKKQDDIQDFLLKFCNTKKTDSVTNIKLQKGSGEQLSFLGDDDILHETEIPNEAKYLRLINAFSNFENEAEKLVSTKSDIDFLLANNNLPKALITYLEELKCKS